MINIEEFADIVKQDLVIRRYPQQGNRYMCHFERAEVKDGAMLIGEHGNGANPLQAMNAYAAKISGKTIVLNAMTNERLEFGVPQLEPMQ